MNASSRIAASPLTPARFRPNLGHAFGGIFQLAWRRYFTVRHGLTVGAALALLALMAGGNVTRQGAEPFFDWTTSFYLTFLVPAMAFIGAAGALRDDLKASTTDYVLTRPIPRWAFVLYRYLSQTILAQLDFLLALGVLLGLGFTRGIPNLASAVPLLLLAQMLMVAAFSALGFLCAVLTSRYVLIGLLYGVVVEVGVGQIPTQLNRLAISQPVRGMLQTLHVDSFATLPTAPWSAALLVLLAVALLLGFTMVIFSRREFIGTSET